MPRANRTYRAARRNDWRKLRGVTWHEHNYRYLITGPWYIGTPEFKEMPEDA